MGAKNTKHKDTEGEPSSLPSPKKSPKRSHRSSRSPSQERTPSPVAGRKDAREPEVKEEIQKPSVARRSETRPDRGSDPRPDRRSDPRPDRRSDPRPDRRSDPHPDHRSEPHPDRPPSHRTSRGHGVPERQSMDVDDHKENVPEIESQTIVEKLSSSPRTPAKMVNGHDTQVEPLTPLNVNDSRISNHIPQATSTPAPNGIITNGPMSPDSDADHTDASDDEGFTPTDQQFQFHDRSPSSGSLISQSTVSSSNKRSQSDSLDRRSEVNYGRFYTSSYLEKGKAEYMKRASLNPPPKSQHKSPHFHRPANFSYSKETPEFLKNMRKSGMAQLATGTKVIVKRTRRASSPGDLRHEEAVRMSMFPAAKPPKPNEVTKIEREDWPGPPSPAAILPELMRARRKSRGEVEDDEELIIDDPKIQKEIDELSKFKNESGIGTIIYKELEERRTMPVKALDPWKSSRAPNAKYEPKYVTRYQSPMFASPSRFLDRPRRSWDDSDIRRGYRTISTMANYPVPKPGYGSYGLTPRAATMPSSGLYGGVFYNYTNYHYFDFDESDIIRHRPSAHTSTSTVNTDHGSRSHISSIHEGPGLSLLTLQRNTWHTEAEPPIYPYEKLKISNFELPKDTDRNMLEIHLVQEDFEELFKMNKEDFSRLAEWKRNDLKRKVDLF